MTEQPCPDRVRAYHEAGHAVLNLVFGYGLAYCSIEPSSDGIGGVSKRISESVADGHYIRILAAGEWAEYQSGHNFESQPCDSGSWDDRLKMTPFLLPAAGYEVDAAFINNLPYGLTPEMEEKLIRSMEWIMEAVTADFSEPSRMALLHELAALLLEQGTLPPEVLDSLNERYPMGT